ncbi:MAG: U32 family peptidase [Spirochaetia bacterium]|nr:U32 family peptidase [Spirochaetales bacterium]MBR4796496.1 U32 family peptidase [Spirochaetia bacterium]MBR5017435.1 U32 family peptidase [Spirochaetia bacterium]MBR5915128.1 U32 family peptidase [Spirochaetia bacterium]MBR5927647.1 U32 family peptidase [Spirochaetia bacterium]
MELLSPAGNIEKLYYAYEYGADAAYIGIKNFSLRAKADNFSADEYEAIRRVKGNKKLYTALNIYFHDSDIETLEKESDYIHQYPLDGFIISDIGILGYLKKNFPDKELHLSTQANCVNTEAAKMYHDMGIKRIVLGRELSLKEIEAIKNNVPGLEIEVFAHGAMCLAYSGRCFLSKYLADRSANQGDCAHSCRWQYRVLEESERPGEYFPVVQGENFTSILSSKDLCMIDHLKELKDAGVDSIKIEGRMKSIYYTAVITRAYRKQLDYIEGISKEDPKPYVDEIFNVSHREFSTGFYYGKDEIEMPTFKSYMSEAQFLGSVEEQAGEGIYRLDVKNQILASDSIEYIGPDLLYLADEGFTLLDEDMQSVPKTDHGKIAYIKTDKKLKKGYIIRKKG